MMMCHKVLDLGSSFDSAVHQYGLKYIVSSLLLSVITCVETIGGMAKCPLFFACYIQISNAQHKNVVTQEVVTLCDTRLVAAGF